MPGAGSRRGEYVARLVLDYIEANVERSLTLTEFLPSRRTLPYRFHRILMVGETVAGHRVRVEKAAGLLPIAGRL